MDIRGELKVTGENDQSSLVLSDLPADVLFHVLSYLDKSSLGRLSRVCKSFNALTSHDCVWLRFSKDATLINQKPRDRGNVTRSPERCTLKERCRISQNWADGCFRDVVLAKHKSRQLPWLQYSDDCLWLSTWDEIRCFTRRRNSVPKEDYRCRLGGLRSDISRFIHRDNLMVASCRDGSVYGWYTDTGQNWFCWENLHTSESQCVDFLNNTIISGSRDKTVKVLHMDSEYGEKEPTTVLCEDRVWSLAISPSGSSFAVGTGGCYGLSALSLFDMSSCSKLLDLPTGPRRGAGVLDVQYDSPHTLLSCGYDTFLRQWDLRTGSCVNSWEEPFDSALYCVRTDQNNVMVTGTARHGMTRLWDRRLTQPIQQYYCGIRSSPVYCLAFDQKHLYVALDLSLHMLDFSLFP